MPRNIKNYADRPSESHKEFVKLSGGRKVRNKAYKKKSRPDNQKLPKHLHEPELDVEAFKTFDSILDDMDEVEMSGKFPGVGSYGKSAILVSTKDTVAKVENKGDKILITEADSDSANSMDISVSDIDKNHIINDIEDMRDATDELDWKNGDKFSPKVLDAAAELLMSQYDKDHSFSDFLDGPKNDVTGVWLDRELGKNLDIEDILELGANGFYTDSVPLNDGELSVIRDNYSDHFDYADYRSTEYSRRIARVFPDLADDLRIEVEEAAYNE